MHEKNSYIYPVSRLSPMAKNQSNFTVRNCGMTYLKMVFQLIKMSLNVSINHIQNNFHFKRILKKHFLYSYTIEV